MTTTTTAPREGAAGRSYKYRIKDSNHREALRAYAYGANQVFNWCVAKQRDVQARYIAGAPRRRWPSYFDLEKECAGVGAGLGIMQATASAVCRQFAQSRDQHRKCPAFRASFGLKRALGWVPFRSRDMRIEADSITYRGRRLRFWVGGRPLPMKPKSGAFIEDARGHWFVVFTVEVDGLSTHAAGDVGIDLGLKSLATTSDGDVIDNPRHLQRYAERLAIAQRSGNKRRATAIYGKIADVRRDFHHKLSTRLACDYAFIAVGDVNAKRLAKTTMAKSVLDAGWSTFRAMLAYKAKEYVEVDERFTTQICSSCGGKPPERPQGIADLGIRVWSCSLCGADHDRDVNAARNILRLARSAPRLAEEIREIA